MTSGRTCCIVKMLRNIYKKKKEDVWPVSMLYTLPHASVSLTDLISSADSVSGILTSLTPLPEWWFPFHTALLLVLVPAGTLRRKAHLLTTPPTQRASIPYSMVHSEAIKSGPRHSKVIQDMLAHSTVPL